MSSFFYDPYMWNNILEIVVIPATILAVFGNFKGTLFESVPFAAFGFGLLQLIFSSIYIFGAGANTTDQNVYTRNIFIWVWMLISYITLAVYAYYKNSDVDAQWKGDADVVIAGYEDTTTGIVEGSNASSDEFINTITNLVTIVAVGSMPFCIPMITYHAVGFSDLGETTKHQNWEIIAFSASIVLLLFLAIDLYHIASKFKRLALVNRNAVVGKYYDVSSTMSFRVVYVPIHPLLIATFNFLLATAMLMFFNDYGQLLIGATLFIVMPLTATAWFNTHAVWLEFFMTGMFLFTMVYTFFPAWLRLSGNTDARTLLGPVGVRSDLFLFQANTTTNNSMPYRTGWNATDNYRHVSFTEMSTALMSLFSIVAATLYHLGRRSYAVKPMRDMDKWPFVMDDIQGRLGEDESGLIASAVGSFFSCFMCC